MTNSPAFTTTFSAFLRCAADQASGRSYTAPFGIFFRSRSKPFNLSSREEDKPLRLTAFNWDRAKAFRDGLHKIYP
jgi:hypothetical protein